MKVCFELVEPVGSSLYESYKIFTKPLSIIGRHQDCDWVIDDDKKIISGRHAEILVRPEGCYIKDVSKNGIYLVNLNKKLDRNQLFLLHDALLIQIGRMKMRVKLIEQQVMPFSGAPELKNPLFALKEPIFYLDQHTFYVYHLALRGFFNKLDIQLEEIHQESLIEITDRCADLLKMSLSSVEVLLADTHKQKIKQYDKLPAQKSMIEKNMPDESVSISAKELILNPSLKFSLSNLEKYIQSSLEWNRRNVQVISELKNILLHILKPEEIQLKIKNDLKSRRFIIFYSHLWDKYKEIYEKAIRYFN